jgi:hypothetical protein
MLAIFPLMKALIVAGWLLPQCTAGGTCTKWSDLSESLLTMWIRSACHVLNPALRKKLQCLHYQRHLIGLGDDACPPTMW